MGRRLEDATCAICMDVLFDKRDDLDDIVHIATCDCGHVFHEPCVLEWFRSQAASWLVSANEHGFTNPDGEPATLADAPAECPSCRAECFADDDGRVMIHRLFINFEGRSSSAAPPGGSSPVREARLALGTQHQEREREREMGKKDRELLGLARRAKGLAEEVNGIEAESGEEDVDAMMGRVSRLGEDLKVSAKARNGIEVYVGGLITAIDRLRSTLKDHPLIAVLQNRIADSRREALALEREMRTAIPREVKKAQEVERAISEKRVRRVVADYEAVKRELEKEKVASKAGRRAMDEKAKELEKQLGETRQRLALEESDREKLQTMLNERSRQLYMFRKENESRKALKAELKEAKEENARLLSQLQAAHVDDSLRRASPACSPRRAWSTPSIDIDLDDDDGPISEGDSSVREISGTGFPTRPTRPTRPTHTLHRRSSGADSSSLQIEMPSFHDESLRGLSRLIPQQSSGSGSGRGKPQVKTARPAGGSPQARAATRGHPTARTMTFDLGEPVGKRRRTNSSKYFLTTDTGGKRTSAAWLDGDESDGAGGAVSREVLGGSPSVSPQRMHPAFGKRQAGGGGNPFAAKKHEGGERHDMPPARQPRPSASASAAFEGAPRGKARAARAPLGKGAPDSRQQSMVAWLGIADVNGRPKAGIVSGQKVKRR